MKPVPVDTLCIRRMELRDISRVSEIDRASFSLPWPERSFVYEVTQNDHARMWVAEDHGTLTGFLAMWLIVDEIHVATLAIDPDFRRQQYASRLLLHGLIEAKKEGALKSFLELRAGNQAACRLYRSFGFVETGLRPRYYADNQEDAILMDLTLSDSPMLQEKVSFR